MRTFIIIASAITSFAGIARGMSPTTSEAEGVVRSVDISANSFVLVRQRSGALPLRWTTKTRFFHSGQPAAPSQFREGVSARVRFRAPFFGPRTATRINF